MKLLRGMIIGIAMLLACCGVMDPDRDGASTLDQPRVIAVEPLDGAEAAADSAIAVEFSVPVTEESVDAQTLAIVRISDDDATARMVATQVAELEVEGLPGAYAFSEEGRRARFVASEAYAPGRYCVVVTPGIVGADLLPFNQRPGGSPQPFVSEFAVAGEGGEAAAGGGEASGSSAGTGSGGGATPERHRPSFLMIHELLYDAAGSDTDGNEFVELYGEPGGDLFGYKVVFINGADGQPTETIELPEGAIVPADGLFLIADARTGQEGVSNIAGAELIENFDPQNGPDCAQLLDDQGVLVDALGYGTPLPTLAADGHPCLEGTAAPKVGSGISLSRTAGADTGDNAADFQALAMPTPGSL